MDEKRFDTIKGVAGEKGAGGGGGSLDEPLFLVDDDMEVDMTIC